MPIATPVTVPIALLLTVSALVSFSEHTYAISTLSLKAIVAQIGFAILLCRFCFTSTFNWSPSLLRYCIILFYVYISSSAFWATNIDFFVNKWLMWFPALVLFIVLSLYPTTNTSIKASTLLNPKQKNNPKYNSNQHQQTLLALNAHTPLSVPIQYSLLVIGTITAFIGILQHLFEFSWFVQAIKPSSLFANKNMAAQVIVLIFPIALFVLFANRKQQWYCNTPLIAFAVASMLLFVFYTKTRAAWLALSIEILFILLIAVYIQQQTNWFLHIKQQLKWLCIALLTMLILTNFNHTNFSYTHFKNGHITPFWETSSERLSSIYDAASNQSLPRYRIWKNTLLMANENPLTGTGLGSYFHNINAYNQWMSTNTFQYAHNDILELLIETGAIGVLLLLLILSITIGYIIKLMCSHPIPASSNTASQNSSTSTENHWQPRLLPPLLGTAIVGIAVNSLFSFPFQWVLPPFILSLYLVSIMRWYEQLYLPQSQLNPSPMLGFSIRVFAVLILAIIITLNWQWSKRFISLERGHYLAKEPWFFNPINITSLRILGSKDYHDRNYQQNVYAQQAIIRYWPNNYLGLEHLAVNYRDMGNIEASLTTLRKLDAIVPDSYLKPEILQLKIYLDQNDIEALTQMYQHILNSKMQWFEKHPLYYESLFSASLLVNDTQRTPYFYAKALTVTTQPYLIERNMAAFYINNKNSAQAIKHIQRALTLAPSPASRMQFVRQMKQLGFQLQQNEPAQQ